jgi:hypothetical protein
MEIKTDKEEMIFRKDYEGKPRYTIGLSKKDKDGKYENGYMTVKFKQDVSLENQTKIRIKSAWLGFNQYENKTYPYIFINEFETIDKKEENPFEQMKAKIASENGVEINDEDLPF